jgi:glycosyltransferase involved in cell wall biosynthesis
VSSLERVVWFGGIFEPECVTQRRAVSPAANLWQLGLVRALRSTGVPVAVISHLPEPLWPRGESRPRGLLHREVSQPGSGSLPYWNLPFLRETLLARAYWQALRRLPPERRPGILFSYNVTGYIARVARQAAKRWGTRWVPLVADVAAERGELARLSHWLEGAAGVVALSWSYFQQTTARHKLHLDGGVAQLRMETDARPAQDAREVLFAGALSRFTGVEQLADAFRLLPEANLRLIICGKGDERLVQRACEADPRICLKGYVSEAELDRLCRRAAVMVNPRPSAIADNAYNFPSKVLEYLSYGSPLVSTWTPGLSPEYRPLLIVPSGESPMDLAGAIRQALGLSTAERLEHQTKVRRFLEGSRTWEKQAQRLLTWLGQVCELEPVRLA